MDILRLIYPWIVIFAFVFIITYRNYRDYYIMQGYKRAVAISLLTSAIVTWSLIEIAGQ